MESNELLGRSLHGVQLPLGGRANRDRLAKHSDPVYLKCPRFNRISLLSRARFSVIKSRTKVTNDSKPIEFAHSLPTIP